MPNHKCSVCHEPAGKRCNGCKTPGLWYCGVECQRYDWTEHIFDCDSGKKVTTAHHLARAVRQNLLPEDPQTNDDYGFDRAATADNRSHLLGLYIGLIRYLEIKPITLHKWRQHGTLVAEIKKAYAGRPTGYYQWFLEHEYVLDRSLPAPGDPHGETLRRFWRYWAGSSSCTITSSLDVNTIRATIDSWPDEKQFVANFCILILGKWHPSPSFKSWIDFGFCVFQTQEEEMELGGLYQNLLQRCSFEEIHQGYVSHTLFSLMLSKGLESELRRCFALGFNSQPLFQLEAFLAEKMRKSVWSLKQFVMGPEEQIQPTPAICVDYGFMRCRSDSEMQELKDVYKTYFMKKGTDPVDLHNAAIKGKIFEHVGGHVKLRKRFKKLMVNPYPLKVPDV